MQIRINPDKELVKEIREKIKENDGYCCCAIEHLPENKCMCEEFVKNTESGFCHCGLYEKY